MSPKVSSRTRVSTAPATSPNTIAAVGLVLTLARRPAVALSVAIFISYGTTST